MPQIFGLDWTIIYVLAIIVGLIFLLYKEIFSTAVNFLFAVAALIIGGILSTKQILNSFANEQVAVIIMLLVLGKFLKRSPVIEQAFQYLFLTSKSQKWFTAKMMAFVSAFSGFMNNTPLVALLMPYVMDWGKANGVHPSKLLIPLSYAAIMGGGLTLIGTSTNLIANTILVETGGEEAGMNMFDFTLVGLPLVIVGILYLIFVGDRLLPNRGGISNGASSNSEYLVDLKVSANSPLIGKTVGEANLRNLNNLYLVEIIRAEQTISPAGPTEVIKAGDYLIFAGATEKIVELVNPTLGLEMPNELKDLSDKKEVVEVIIPYNSNLARKKIKKSNFRSQYDAAIIAVRRDGEKLYGKIGDITLRRGDMLLCVAGPDFYKRIGLNSDLTLVSNVKELADIKGWKSRLLIIASILTILFSSLKLISLFNALLLELVLLLVTRVIRFGEVKRALNINLIVIMAGALALGTAMSTTGAAELIANQGLSLLSPFGLMAILAGLYLLTNLLAAYMTNIAAISIVLPIALSYASSVGLQHLPFTLCVAFAGSKNFITPIGYQTNLMVYGPGGYKFNDFMRVGLPLTIIFMIVTLATIKLFYL
jgi:di/tricarboxylate transporter